MGFRKRSVLVFGTYDPRDSRARIMVRAMRLLGWQLTFCHRCPMSSEAKVAAVSRPSILPLVLGGLRTYLWMVCRAVMSLPCTDVLVPSGGYIDILFGWMIARLAGARLIFDPLYGLYETVVEDRRLVAEHGGMARAIRFYERLCFRLADVVLVDTEEHRDYFVRHTGLPLRRIVVVPVGAEEDLFYPAKTRPAVAPAADLHVFFYGTMIPLHGVDTIIRAARLLRADPVRFTLVGQGQMRAAAEQLARDLGCDNVCFRPTVPYAALPGLIREADVCLGIFGTSAKTQRVVPTKVYGYAAAGQPVITGDTPAIRRAFRVGRDLLTVPCNDPEALARAIRQLAADPALRQSLGASAGQRFVERYSTAALAARLRVLEESA
jgi:glycosyltransferase involved in cell wall biosynthesis